MDKTKLEDINILEFGNSIQMTSVVYSKDSLNYLCILPDENKEEILNNDLTLLDLSVPDWERLLRQTDILEVEKKTGEFKAVVRKSQRQIDQAESWFCFRRDDYKCRYCGRNDVPLTVDHIILWEDGGASVRENLLSCCKPCNRTRGNIPYEEWIVSPSYKKRSVNLTEVDNKSNLNIVSKLDELRKLNYSNQRSR